ncbi:MAG: T9SS type A sorting domain-containing protein, partial [Bacteroidota bacterium]
ERSACFFWAPPLVSAEASLTSRLRLYPNPGSGQATLDLSVLSQPAEVRIYDARGRWLGSMERLRGSVEVDLRKFGGGPGLYLLQVQAGAEMGTLRMVWE